MQLMSPSASPRFSGTLVYDMTKAWRLRGPEFIRNMARFEKRVQTELAPTTVVYYHINNPKTDKPTDKERLSAVIFKGPLPQKLVFEFTPETGKPRQEFVNTAGPKTEEIIRFDALGRQITPPGATDKPAPEYEVLTPAFIRHDFEGVSFFEKLLRPFFFRTFLKRCKKLENGKNIQKVLARSWYI